jgi:ABC-type phosphate transport system substrate-binding protein
VVIVNKNNQLESLSAAKIKVIYLRKISRWPWGAEIMPVDLSAKTALRTTFVESVLNISPHELDVYWIDQRVSRSLSPPTQVPSVKAAKALVAANPGAVAYIPQSEVDDSVRVIALR